MKRPSSRRLPTAQGRVVEAGPHGELLAQGGKYAELWARQQAHVDEIYDSASEDVEGPAAGGGSGGAAGPGPGPGGPGGAAELEKEEAAALAAARAAAAGGPPEVPTGGP